jgi:hypothetical protein
VVKRRPVRIGRSVGTTHLLRLAHATHDVTFGIADAGGWPPTVTHPPTDGFWCGNTDRRSRPIWSTLIDTPRTSE